MDKLPPFYVGQRIVSLRISTVRKWLKKDKIYIIESLDFCCEWLVDVGFKIELPFVGNRCTICKKLLSGREGIDWVYARHFAPIREDFQEISFEKVIEKEKSLICVN